MTDTTKLLPPHNADAERSVIGSCILSRDALNTVIDILKPEDFYDTGTHTVYGVITEMYASDKPVDFVTLSDELKNRGVYDRLGGDAYLAEILNRVTMTGTAGYHASLVRDYSLRRKLIRASDKISELAYKPDREIPDIISESERIIFEASQGKDETVPSPVSELSDTVFHDIETVYRSGGRKLSGYASGFEDLDRIISGFQPGSLNIIAARPSMGKTALALNIAQFGGSSDRKPCVLIFSLEMSREQLMQRMYSAESEVKLSSITSGLMTEEEFYYVSKASERFHSKEIHISDNSELSAIEFRSKCRRFKARHPDLSLIVVDYLQLMQTGNRYRDNRNQEVSEISRMLKSVAIELECPIIALSQLSREAERRTEKKPRLSDLRDSGAIEQDADLVILLFREDYYEDNTSRADKYDSKAELNVAKNRNGRTGTCNLTFRREYTKFAGYAGSF